MKLSGFEQMFLEKELSIPCSDIPQMCAAASKTQHTIDGKRASRAAVMDALGFAGYMSALHRAAFHRTAARMDGDGRVVMLDASKFFRTQEV